MIPPLHYARAPIPAPRPPVRAPAEPADRVTLSADACPWKPKWKLVWSDEFNAPDGTPPDASKWTIERGGDGWGNHELEYYTARPENVVQRGGNLEITARQENYSGPDGVSRPYTSARLKTDKLFAQRYGRFEARIKIPAGQGMWPAFWMLGDDIAKSGWPGCGEIDVMENVGNEPSKVHGSMHGPGYSGGNPMTGTYSLHHGKKFSDDFHTFAVEWEPDRVRFFVDDKKYETVRRKDLPPGTKWVFDHPFFMLLNLAVGGDWPGAPDGTTKFPQTMQVDWVRAYERE